MPRPVAIRASYRDDASHLLRLEAAISKDRRQTQSWRVGTMRLVRKLALRLLEAEGRPEDAGLKVVAKKRRRGPGIATSQAAGMQT